MRSKSNKIQFIALAFVMLFSVMNVWGIEVIHKGIIARHSTFEKSYPNDTHSSFNNSYGTYTWTSDNSYLVALKSSVLTWGNTIDLSEYDYVIVGTSVKSGTAQIIIDYKDANNQDQLVKYPITPGVCKINLEGIWRDYYDANVDIRQTNLLKKVTGIRFGGTSTTGEMYFKEISFAKKGRTVDWDVNGHIVLGYEDILGDIWWTSRDGDYIEKTNTVRADNYGHYATFISSFDQCLDVRTVTFNGKVYNGANNLIENFITRNLYDNDDVTRKDNRTYHGKDKLNEEISMSNNSTLSDVEFMLSGTGSMHLYNIVIRHKDVKTITFNSVGGTEFAPVDFYHTAINLPKPSKEGYKFMGWKDPQGNYVSMLYSPTSDITLTAEWIEGQDEFDVVQNRIYHLDFEGMDNDDLLPGTNAPTEGLSGVTEEAYYNYGGKGRILIDSNPNFNKYYQNLAVGTDEFTKSLSENFLRVVFTDDQKQKFNNIIYYSNGNGYPNYSKAKPVSERAATVGFWVNAKLANKYELPLERGSMFCIFSNERFQKADDNLNPRYMFDIACNGWIYSYMPNSYNVNKKDANGNNIIGKDGNPEQEFVEYMNKFFYGERADVVSGTPKESFFGEANYSHTQDQRKHKFYDDNNWHYVTYVAENDLKKVTMYLDGVMTKSMDLTTLGDDCKFEEGGDYGARVFYLRNLVLGGFTPHGLFFNGPKDGGQYYSDAALAYDDISIYSVALTPSQIQSIINQKKSSTSEWEFADVPTEWHFIDALKSYNSTSFNGWSTNGNLKSKNLSTISELQIDSKTLYSTEHLKFSGNVSVDTRNGLVGLTDGSKVVVPQIPANYYAYFVTKTANGNLGSSNITASLNQFESRGVSLYGGDGKDDFSVLNMFNKVHVPSTVNFSYNVGVSTDIPYGDSNVDKLNFADISAYKQLVVAVSEGTPRFLFNRDIDEGSAPDHLIEIPNNSTQTDTYQKENGNVYTIDLARIKEDKGFVHLHAIKGANWSNVKVTSMKLVTYDDKQVDLTASMYERWLTPGANAVTYGTTDCEFTVNNNTLWFSDVIISPYGLMYKNADNSSVNHIDIDIDAAGDKSSYDLPSLVLKDRGVDVVNAASFTKGDVGNAPYIRYSSSAPRVAYVNQSGDVTITGLAGYATIKAELIFGNLHDGCISTAYELRVNKDASTNVVANEYASVANSSYGVGKVMTTANQNITMTLGGWTYGSASKNSYIDEDDKPVTDSWTRGYGHVSVGSPESIDGFSNATQGAKDAKDESYGVYKDNEGNILYTRYGNYDPVKTSVVNSTPWTLPCRGSYLKFEPEKAGVLTVYVLQNGNLYKASDSDNYSSHVAWRPVYIADETGKVVDFVKYSTNSKISENDNFFKEGRRRAQFIEGVADTYNQSLKTDLLNLKSSNYNRFKRLIDYWSNAGWKQKVIPTGDGGYMVMSKGIVRYSFNVYPGKTYYVFSNDTKIGYSGYNFEEGKLLNENDDQYETNPVKPAFVQTAAQVYNDVLGTPAFPTGKDCVPVTYNRTFTSGVWGSICLPFSMNNKQMKENFGDETSVVLLKEIDKDGVVQMVWHVNQDIIAGYPYFILPRGKVKGAEVTSITQINTNAYFDPTVKAPSFVVGPKMVNGQSATYGSVELLLSAGDKSEYPYVFKGNFATEKAPAGSYVMLTNGVLTRAKNEPNIKPFRAYLRYCDGIDDTAEARPLTGMGYMNSDGEEVTTSIEQILEANGIFVDSANVYGVDGQIKRYNTHDLNGLPKGIYIVNGKKYVVK